MTRAFNSAFAATSVLLVGALALASDPVGAQQSLLVYRLGKDTVAMEQYTRSATRMAGEMVQRSGAAVVRAQYDITIGADGRPTAATVRRLLGDGTVPPNSPNETRFKITADSIIREVAWPDSVQRRAFAASKALINFPVFAYGPTELLATLNRGGTKVDSIVALGLAGGPGFTGFTSLGGDSVRLRGGGYAVVMRFDASGKLVNVDGNGTTNKAIGTRSTGSVDIAAVARTMKPTGVLSARDIARAAFGAGGMVLIDYSRPQVRERTVWGGALIPFDSVWRAGANDATHLFTTRTLALGSLTLAPGMYTLWVQHTRAGTSLIVNKQTGQWGTQYDAAQDIGRVPMQLAAAPNHIEEFTTTVRALGGNRGAIEMAWGPSVATVPFTVSAARP